jgi:hypothetical protein
VGAVVEGLGLVVEDDGFGAGRGVPVAVALWVAVVVLVRGGDVVVALVVAGSAVAVGVERCRRARAEVVAARVAESVDEVVDEVVEAPGVARTWVRVPRGAGAAADAAVARCACLAASRCSVS